MSCYIFTCGHNDTYKCYSSVVVEMGKIGLDEAVWNIQHAFEHRYHKLSGSVHASVPKLLWPKS